MDPKFLGKPTTGPSTELDTFPNPGIDVVTMTSDEVTSFCPVTAQPDYYTVSIEYVPDQLCIESKSLKLYLWHFRDRQIFAETLAVEIKDKIAEVIKPVRCTITAIQKSRGGIEITSVAHFNQD
ncbi:MAG: preQ(1) synthase [Chloroflexota bacterium]